MKTGQYWKELTLFLKEKCVGPQYDSCHDSPCLYASHQGCTNKDHPIHKFREDQNNETNPLEGGSACGWMMRER